jgi:hypothetical protein
MPASAPPRASAAERIMPPTSLAPARICCVEEGVDAGRMGWAAVARPPGASSQAVSQASTVMRSSAPSELDMASTTAAGDRPQLGGHAVAAVEDERVVDRAVAGGQLEVGLAWRA